MLRFSIVFLLLVWQVMAANIPFGLFRRNEGASTSGTTVKLYVQYKSQANQEYFTDPHSIVVMGDKMIQVRSTKIDGVSRYSVVVDRLKSVEELSAPVKGSVVSVYELSPTEKTLQEVVDFLQDEYVWSYHLGTNNCNHLANQIIEYLGVHTEESRQAMAFIAYDSDEYLYQAVMEFRVSDKIVPEERPVFAEKEMKFMKIDRSTIVTKTKQEFIEEFAQEFDQSFPSQAGQQNKEYCYITTAPRRLAKRQSSGESCSLEDHEQYEREKGLEDVYDSNDLIMTENELHNFGTTTGKELAIVDDAAKEISVMDTIKVVGEVAGELVDITAWALTSYIILQDIKDNQYAAAVSTAGNFAGALAGMELGAEVGLVMGPIGSFIGGALGGLIGGFAGEILGGALSLGLPFGNHLNEESTLNGLIFKSPITGIPQANQTFVLPQYLSQLMPNIPPAFWRGFFVKYNRGMPMVVQDMYKYVDANVYRSRPIYNSKWEEWQRCRNTPFMRYFCRKESKLDAHDMHVRHSYDYLTLNGRYMVTSVKPVCGILDYRSWPYGYQMDCSSNESYRLLHNGTWTSDQTFTISNSSGAYNLMGYDMQPTTVYNNENYMVKTGVSEIDCGRICDNDKKCRGFVYQPDSWTCFFKEKMDLQVLGQSGYFAYLNTRRIDSSDIMSAFEALDVGGETSYFQVEVTSTEECALACYKYSSCVYFENHQSTCIFYDGTGRHTGSGRTVYKKVKLSEQPFSLELQKEYSGEAIGSIMTTTYADCLLKCDSRFDCVGIQYNIATQLCLIKGENGQPVGTDADLIAAYKEAYPTPKYEAHVRKIHEAVSKAIVADGWMTPQLPFLPSGASLLYYSLDSLSNFQSLPLDSLSTFRQRLYADVIQQSFSEIFSDNILSPLNNMVSQLSDDQVEKDSFIGQMKNISAAYYLPAPSRDLSDQIRNFLAKYVLNSLGYTQEIATYHYEKSSADNHSPHDKKPTSNYYALFDVDLKTAAPHNSRVQDVRENFKQLIHTQSVLAASNVTALLRTISQVDISVINETMFEDKDKQLFQVFLQLWGMLSGENRTLHGESESTPRYGLDGLGSAVIVLDARRIATGTEQFSKWLSVAWLNVSQTAENGRITWDTAFDRIGELETASMYLPQQIVVAVLYDDESHLPRNYLDKLKEFSSKNMHVIIPRHSTIQENELDAIVMAPAANEAMHPVLEGVIHMTSDISRRRLNLILPSEMKIATTTYLNGQYATCATIFGPNLIVNGGFESTTCTNDCEEDSSVADPWIFAPGKTQHMKLVKSTWKAAEGNWSIDLQGTSIQQTVASLSVGSRYKLRFLLNRNPRRRNVTGEVLLDGTSIYRFQHMKQTGWIEHTVELNANSPSHVIEFQSNSPDGEAGPALDYIRLNQHTANC